MAELLIRGGDDLGRKLESATAVNDGRGFRKIERLIDREQPIRVGIEGSGSYGLALAQRRLARGVDVRGVPPQLTRRERKSHAKGKSDALDALLIARVVVRDPTLPQPPKAALAYDLKALVDHRDTLLEDATQHRNRAHALLVQIRPGTSGWCPSSMTRPKSRRPWNSSPMTQAYGPNS